MPSDIVSTDYKVPEEKRVDLGPMTERHRKIIRFHYDNKHKEILLRPLNYIDMEIVNSKINGQYPEYPKWCTEAEQLWKVQLKGQGLPPEGMERLQQLSKLMLPFRHEFSIRCFVDPKTRDGRGTEQPAIRHRPGRERRTGRYVDAIGEQSTGERSVVGLPVAG